MTLAYHNMTLEELERIAYQERNTLALAILEVSEANCDGVETDIANLENRIEDMGVDLSQSRWAVAKLTRERDTLLDNLSALEAQFEQACVELREMNLEKES